MHANSASTIQEKLDKYSNLALCNWIIETRNARSFEHIDAILSQMKTIGDTWTIFKNDSIATFVLLYYGSAMNTKKYTINHIFLTSLIQIGMKHSITDSNLQNNTLYQNGMYWK